MVELVEPSRLPARQASETRQGPGKWRETHKILLLIVTAASPTFYCFSFQFLGAFEKEGQDFSLYGGKHGINNECEDHRENFRGCFWQRQRDFEYPENY